MTWRTWARIPSRTAWNLSMRCCSWAASWLSSGRVTIGNFLPLDYAVLKDWPDLRLWNPDKETADLSTTLRSGRDDNFVATKISYFSWKHGLPPSNKIVISAGAQRSGEICGL